MSDNNDKNIDAEEEAVYEALERSFKKRGLGRGLNALFEDEEGDYPSGAEAQQESSGPGRKMIDIAKIRPGEFQPRKTFDDAALKELSESVKKHGLLQPILVRESGGEFEIVAGERRWRAAQSTELKILPSLLLPEDLDKDEVSLIENIQREDLKISEEAQAYKMLIDKNNYTHENLSLIVGKSRSHITNLLRILNLDEFFFSLLNKGILTMGHARALVGKKPENYDEKTLTLISSGKISVRDLEKNKRKISNNEPNLIQEEKNLSATIGFKTKITYSKK